MSGPAIVFDGVSKSFPLYHHITRGIKGFLFNIPEAVSSLRSARYEALRDVSFEVQRGEALGIIGRNGAGKSTTLGLMAGVIRPTKGRVEVRGRTLPLLELGGGFHPELTGKENIVLNGVLLGLRRRDVLARMDDIVEFSGLGDLVEQPIRTYSSGMLSRLGFSVAAHLDPEIMLIDEILAVGDMAFRERCLERMMGFKRAGVTMVFVSHSMEDVEWLCDRAIWIEDHTVRAAGPPASITLEYAASQTGRHPERAKSRPPWDSARR